jgi:hypothetical protein
MQQQMYPQPKPTQTEGQPKSGVVARPSQPNETDAAALNRQDSEGPIAVSEHKDAKPSSQPGAKVISPADTTLHVGAPRQAPKAV